MPQMKHMAMKRAQPRRLKGTSSALGSVRKRRAERAPTKFSQRQLCEKACRRWLAIEPLPRHVVPAWNRDRPRDNGLPA